MKKTLQTIVLSGFFYFLYLGFATAQTTSLAEALEQAKTENKVIFMNFSGSDWCRSCILLKKTILTTEVFKKFAEKELIILDVDFPRLKKNQLSKKQVATNEKLAEKYNPEGQFPTIVILDKNSKIIGKTAYKKISPEQYVEHIKSMIKE